MKYFLFSLLVLFLLACSTGDDKSIRSEVPFVDTGVDPNSWALVPAGQFLKGQHNHPTPVDYDYEIMITDVTNEQYANYLNEALAKGTIKVTERQVMGFYPGEKFDGYNHEVEINAGDWLHVPLDEMGINITFDGETFSSLKGYENHPMVMVTWFGAKAYADFYGWRLPTEIEWEKAARGPDARVYPWGNEIARNQANFHSSKDVVSKLFGERKHTTPVGYYNGSKYGDYQTIDAKSPYGLYDMAGNVWQWVGDDYPKMHLRYMRGGSEANYEYNLRGWARNSAGPDFFGLNIGFRCAREVEVDTTVTAD